MAKDKITSTIIKDMKHKGEKIVALTAWDYTSAKIVESAGVEIVLVGDSLSMTIRGDSNTLKITLEDMIYHTRMVSKACVRALVVADMPFMSFQVSAEQATMNAGRFLKEGDAHAVKIEGGAEMADTVKKVTAAGIPVMGHIGLTPQSIHLLGGFKVQGKAIERAKDLLADAKALEEAGAFSIVLECVPAPLATYITEKIDIPTISIGAGDGCDGQVQVTADVIGLKKGDVPKHAKKYVDLNQFMTEAVRQYADEVRNKVFPTKDHSFSASPELEDVINKGEI